MSGLNPLIFHPFLSVLSSVLSSVPSQKYFQLVIWTFSLRIFAISANSPSSSLLDNTCENAYPVQRGINYTKQARTERSPAPASMLISLCLYQYATDQCFSFSRHLREHAKADRNSFHADRSCGRDRHPHDLAVACDLIQCQPEPALE